MPGSMPLALMALLNSAMKSQLAAAAVSLNSPESVDVAAQPQPASNGSTDGKG